MPRFPPRGPHGRLFPRFHGTIKALRLPAAHPAALRFLRLAVPRSTYISLPPPLRAAAAGLGVVHSVSPSGKSSWRRQEFPSSWGALVPVCTWSPTPAGRCVPDRLRDAHVAPATRTTKAPTTTKISGLNSMAFGLAAYVSRCWLPVTAQDWLPGAGQALLGGRLPAGLR